MAEDEFEPKAAAEPTAKTGAFQISQDPVTGAEMADDVHKYEIAAEAAAPTELPA
jgi:hypothetical protein